ncbi:hypothetical protein JVU11DRAFT_1939 [Chiua virens]|nr:hypothetical protein JVU11DRAFT_1939 [Chiua virens]
MEVAQGPGMQLILKALRNMKVKDLPIEDTLVAKYDPFGINENPDLMPTIQQLWDDIFNLGDARLDVTKYPAIKKIACDRLNTWCSDIGKCGIYCLEQYFKASEYIKDCEARVAFVKSQVPFIRDSNDKPMFPLIYKDPENMKGAWEAPLMTLILTKHLQWVGANQFLAFGKPFGALALCAASLEHALELFRGGENVKNILDFTGDGDSQGCRSGKNQFDHKFAMAAQQYASSTSGLSENKSRCNPGRWESKSEEMSTGMNRAGEEAGLDGVGDEKASIDNTEGEEADMEGVDGGQGRATEDVEDENRSHSGWHGDSEDSY